MIISLAGKQGAGKSTIGKLLSEHLGYKKYSTGDFMRQLAQERGMTILELNQYSETDGGEIDRILDDRQKEFGETQDQFIIDGRLSFHFIPHSFKIYLDIDPRVGAERILSDTDNVTRSATEQLSDIQQVIESTQARVDSEIKRYKQYYGIDNHDPKNFDLVINTTSKTPEEIVKLIMSHIVM